MSLPHSFFIGRGSKVAIPFDLAMMVIGSGGGGGDGNSPGGGGGAGALLDITGSLLTSSNTTYTVTVGVPGKGSASSDQISESGNQSSFSNGTNILVAAYGGGRGGSFSGAAYGTSTGQSFGSGGGGSGPSNYNQKGYAGLGASLANTSGFANFSSTVYANDGYAWTGGGSYGYGGGGGGAGSAASSNTAGGAGLYRDWMGTNLEYAAGGNGANGAPSSQYLYSGDRTETIGSGGGGLNDGTRLQWNDADGMPGGVLIKIPKDIALEEVVCNTSGGLSYYTMYTGDPSTNTYQFTSPQIDNIADPYSAPYVFTFKMVAA